LKDISHPHTLYYFKVFVSHIRSASESCLMVAALIKCNTLLSNVITENLYVSESAVKHASKQANIKLGFI
jgi:hypothetical protein